MATTINPSDQTITQYNIQTGGAANLLNNVAPSATSGVPVISQGASAQPIFGTAVVAGGGTGRVTLTNHGVLVGAATSAITQLAAGSSGQVLQSGGASADPAYSTATYPATATGTGTLLRADGTNWTATTSTYPNTNAINTLLYASSANVMSALATANNGVLTTGATGIPAITALASDGQLLIGSSAGAPTAATLTAGTGITVTNANNSITIAASGAGILTFGPITLTNAQIKSLNASPITLIAAPGAGKTIVPITAAARLNYGGNNPFVSGGNFKLYLTASYPILNLGSFYTQSTNHINVIAVSLAVSSGLAIENTALTISTDSSNPTGNAANDNTVEVYGTYTIVTW